MSNSNEQEPKSWPVESEGESDETDFAFERLKQEIASARRVLHEHRERLSSIGRSSPEATNDDDPPA